jgi:Uma2 family endonuclease
VLERGNALGAALRWFWGVSESEVGMVEATLANRERVHIERDGWVWPRPITFDEYLSLFEGTEGHVELTEGSVKERSMVQLDHERVLLWLFHLAGLYAEELGLGSVFGSRTAVQISQFRGRLPDLLFVRRERAHILQQKAVYDAPDLVVEVLSSGDPQADVVALEADYPSIGVAEIVFVDRRRQRVRILRKRDTDYEEVELTDGDLALETLPGFHVQVAWLLGDERPPVRLTLDALLAGARGE